MDDNALKIDQAGLLLETEYRTQIDKILNNWEKTVSYELSSLGYNVDLSSDDADRFLNGFTHSEKDGKKIINRKKMRDDEIIAVKYLTLQRILWIRAAIKDDRLLPALLFSIEAAIAFMVSDYAIGKSSREAGQAAAEKKADESSALYKKLLARDDELKSDNRYGRYIDGRARQIALELKQTGIELTPDAVKKGIAKERKKIKDNS